jgi:hypothetical protein
VGNFCLHHYCYHRNLIWDPFSFLNIFFSSVCPVLSDFLHCIQRSILLLVPGFLLKNFLNFLSSSLSTFSHQKFRIFFLFLLLILSISFLFVNLSCLLVNKLRLQFTLIQALSLTLLSLVCITFKLHLSCV